MAKLTISNISADYGATTSINNAFDAVETAIENTLSRDGTAPNAMAAELDMGTHRIINVAQPVDPNDGARKKDVDAVVAAGLPDQTGYGTKFLQTDGTTATWETPAGTEVSNTPAGNIAATTVQAAIDELDTEKVPETDFSAYGKTLVDDADAATARATLGLGTLAVESTAPIAKGGSGQVTAQAAIDALSQVSAATNEYVLTKDTATGNALWKVNAAVGRSGEVIIWPLSTPKLGTLECDGSAVSRTTYADLFAAIGTTYGVGDGTTTFNIPDFRGEFLRGWDHTAGNDPDAATRTDRGDGTTGDNVGTKQADDFLSHTHYAVGIYTTVGGSNPYYGGGSKNADVYTNAQGGNETRPRNVNQMFCIYY